MIVQVPTYNAYNLDAQVGIVVRASKRWQLHQRHNFVYCPISSQGVAV
jgi:hypothetical protein